MVPRALCPISASKVAARSDYFIVVEFLDSHYIEAGITHAADDRIKISGLHGEESNHEARKSRQRYVSTQFGLDAMGDPGIVDGEM